NEMTNAPPYPRPVDVASENSPIDGSSSVQNGRCAAPIVVPIMKKINVMNMTERPPPMAYNVPDAQPPPSCMPTPTRNAPTITLTPTGDTYPATSAPKNEMPKARIGANNMVAAPSITICARIASPLPTDMRHLKAEVKPNRAWNNV